MSKKQTSFEEAAKKLEDIVNELESGDLALDDALKRFESGIEIASAAEKALQDAEEKIQKLKEKLREQSA